MSALVMCQSFISLTPALFTFFLEGSANLNITSNPNPQSPGLGMSYSSFSSSEADLSSVGWAPSSSRPCSLSSPEEFSDSLSSSTAYRFFWTPEHLPVFPLRMSTEMGSGGRSSGTCDIATIYPLESHTSTSIRVPKETDLSVVFIIMEPVKIVTWLPVSPSPAPGRDFTALVLADCFIAGSVVFLTLWSSTVSFFLCWVDFTRVICHFVAIGGETGLFTATVEASLDAGLFGACRTIFQSG